MDISTLARTAGSATSTATPTTKSMSASATKQRSGRLFSPNLKRWRRENPQKMAVQLARRRARKLDADEDFTVEEFEALCEKYGNMCLRCSDRDSLLTPDHAVPLSLGAATWQKILSLCAATATPGRTSRSSTTAPTRFWPGPQRRTPRRRPISLQK
jgi:hypothetical protein